METLAVKIKLAWWCKPYVYTLAAFCAITGREPNWERVKYWINRAIKVEAPK